MINIITTGRTDIEDFFHLSSALTSRRLSHHPFIVFCTGEALFKDEFRYLKNTVKRIAELKETIVPEYEKEIKDIQAMEKIDGRKYQRNRVTGKTQTKETIIKRIRESIDEINNEVLPQLESQLNDYKKIVVPSDSLEVRIVDRATDLLEYPDDTKVMAQWGGEWSSDFMKFTVGDVRKYLKENNVAP